jgi:hypothetical protein
MTEYTREEFYDLIWTTRENTIYAELRSYALNLKALCQKFNVPMPDEEYWAAVRAKQAPERVACRRIPGPRCRRLCLGKKSEPRNALPMRRKSGNLARNLQRCCVRSILAVAWWSDVRARSRSIGASGQALINLWSTCCVIWSWAPYCWILNCCFGWDPSQIRILMAAVPLWRRHDGLDVLAICSACRSSSNNSSYQVRRSCQFAVWGGGLGSMNSTSISCCHSASHVRRG